MSTDDTTDQIIADANHLLPNMVFIGNIGESEAQNVLLRCATAIAMIGQNLDVKSLTKVTIAAGDAYAKSLLALDRGTDTPTKPLTPTNDSKAGVGVGMTPRVIREGRVMSEMFLRAENIVAIREESGLQCDYAWHLIYHECAHVHITAAFERAFPGLLMRKQTPSILNELRQSVAYPCWDEFFATHLSANVGPSEFVLNGYRDTFLHLLQSTRPGIKATIQKYRINGDHEWVLRTTYDLCGSLLKYGAYLLGTLAGQSKTIDCLPETKSAIDRSWFRSYFYDLDRQLRDLMWRFGEWDDIGAFESIGGLATELVAENGVTATPQSDGGCHVTVPY